MQTQDSIIAYFESASVEKQSFILSKAFYSLLTFYEVSPFSKVEEYFVKQVLNHYNSKKEISGIYLENSIDLYYRYSSYLAEIANIKASSNSANDSQLNLKE